MSIKVSLGLHVCPVCTGSLVQPLAAEPLDGGLCYVELLCPNCWRGRHSVHRQDEVDRFEDELCRGDAALFEALEELARSNLREEIERFAQALAADAILPMDF